MTVTYNMEVLENYNSTWATDIDSGSPLPTINGMQDKINTGVRFDPVRRKIMYAMFMYDTSPETNTTGFTLWDGLAPIVNGASYTSREQKCQWMAEKDIDTGAVTFYNNYDSSKLVPNGIGPTAIGYLDFNDGDIMSPGDNIVLNGVTWTFVASGATGNQTNIQGDYLSTLTQLSWDLNNSTNASLTPAYYTAGNLGPAGHFCLGVTYKLGGTAGNSYTLGLGTIAAGRSGATLTGGGTPSNGTWRRYVDSTSSEGDADPMMIDPRTGNVWQHTDSNELSCAIYFFARTDNFSQVISPYQPPPGQSSHMELIGISDEWAYVRLEQGNQTNVFTITLTPRVPDATEIALDAIVPYAEFPYDPLWNNYYFRSVFNHSTSMFTYGGAQTGTRDFKLYKFNEPSSAPFGGPVIGGGFTDITPWGPSTGPNSNVAAYTVDGTFATPSTGQVNKYLLYYLPATDDLVCINKLWAGDTTGGWSDPNRTRFDCTYVDVGGGTFDYHEGFVTGYMKSDWTTTTNPAQASWAVLNLRELDTYLGQNTYNFTSLGTDYTERWFYFGVQPVVAGAWSYDTSTYHTIMVKYRFVYGSAPEVIQVIDEINWDTVYSAYGVTIGNPNVVYNSLGDLSQNDQIDDTGISDGNSFIWGVYGYQGNNICYLNSDYIPDRRNQIIGGTVIGPFLRVSFGSIPIFTNRRWGVFCGPVVDHG